MKIPLTSYVALLRGINVGGNRIIKMADLKKSFEQLGFSNVTTYIQSGNVLFTTSAEDGRKLEQKIEKVLTAEYRYPSKVVIRTLKEMEKTVKGLPKDWKGTPDKKYNVLFLRAAIDSKKILEDLRIKPDIESLSYRPGVLYWSANTSDLTRSSMVKLASKPVYKEITIRNLNTTKKIFELLKELGSEK